MEEDIVVVPHETGPYREPHSLIDALSDIQQYIVMESNGQVNFPEHYLTPRRKLAYFQIGFTYGFGESLFHFLIAPLFYGVLFNYFTVFGKSSVSFIDKVYVFILTKYLSVALLTVFLILFAKAKGPLSGGCTNAMAAGYTASLVIRVLAALLGYRLIYSIWPEILQKVYNLANKFFSYDLSLLQFSGKILISIANFFAPLNKLFLISSNYETLFSGAMFLVLILTWVFFKLIQKKQLNPYYQRFA